MALALTLAGLLVCARAQTQSDQKKKDSAKPVGSTAQLSDATARKAPVNGQTVPSAMKTKNTNMTDVYVSKTKNSSVTSGVDNTNPPATHLNGQNKAVGASAAETDHPETDHPETPQAGTSQPGQIQDQAINANPGPRHRPGTPANNHKSAAPAAPQHGQLSAPEPKR